MTGQIRILRELGVFKGERITPRKNELFWHRDGHLRKALHRKGVDIISKGLALLIWQRNRYRLVQDLTLSRVYLKSNIAAIVDYQIEDIGIRLFDRGAGIGHPVNSCVQ